MSDVTASRDVAGRGVAASALAGLLRGPDRPGVVVAAGPRAAVIAVQPGPRCVCLLGPGTTRLPNGIHPDPAVPPAGLPTGAPVSVGRGGLRTGDLMVRVVRWWNSRVPLIRPSAAGLDLLARSAARAERGITEAAIGRLDRALASAEQVALSAAVGGLVGLGPGSTPAGDDVLAGTCVGLLAVGRTDLVDRLASGGVTDAGTRTTALSADLLRLAARGEACAEALAVIRSLHAAGRSDTRLPALRRAVGALLSVGHTSGADLTAGMLLGLRHAEFTPDRDSRQVMSPS